MGRKIRQSLIALVLALIAIALSVASLLPLYSGATSPNGIFLYASLVPLALASYFAFKVFAKPNEPEEPLEAMFKN